MKKSIHLCDAEYPPMWSSVSASGRGEGFPARTMHAPAHGATYRCAAGGVDALRECTKLHKLTQTQPRLLGALHSAQRE